MSELHQSAKGERGGQLRSEEAALVAGALIASGALAALVLALRRVRKLVWWLIPVGLFASGIAVSVKTLQEREAKIEEVEEEIVSLLGQLDPVAKAQVVLQVAEAELDKG